MCVFYAAHIRAFLGAKKYPMEFNDYGGLPPDNERQITSGVQVHLPLALCWIQLQPLKSLFMLTPPLTAPENFHVFTITQVDTMLGMGWGLLTFACTCKPS